MATLTYNATGSVQTQTIPTGVRFMRARLWGAGADGTGGYVEGYFSVDPGDTLYLYVGEQASGTTPGWPGGGSGGSSGPAVAQAGAGFTAVRLNGDTFADTVCMAGGAGGYGEHYEFNSTIEAGGDGGSNTAESGDGFGAGGGGTQSAGGDGGTAGSDGGRAGEDGDTDARGYGGDGVSSFSADTDGNEAHAASGGGGAGWHGGGSGGCDASVFGGSDYTGGGGGGSNYVSGFDEVILNQRGAGNSGDGQIELWYPTINVYDSGQSAFVQEPVQFWDGDSWEGGIINYYDGSWQQVDQ